MRKKRSRFFYSIFIPILILGAVLVTGFTTYIYQDATKTYENNLVTEKSRALSQTKINLEQKIQTIEYAFTTYSSTANFKKIIAEPLNYRNFAEVREVNSELAYIGVMGIENTNYSIISLAQNWQIKGGSLEQISQETADKYQKLIASTNEDLVWVPKNNKIQMIISLPIFSRIRNGVGIAEIDTTVIKNLVKDYEDPFFSIYNGQGEMLFENDHPLKASLLKEMSQKEEPTGVIEDEKGDFYLYNRSNYNQWLYVSRVKKGLVKKATQGMRLGLLGISVFVIFLLGLLAYFIADRSSRPIKQIKDRLLVAENKEDEKNEINNILRGIENIVSKNENLSLRVQQEKPELEQLFILNLFRKHLDGEDIKKRLEQFDYPTQGEKYVTMLIQIDDLGGREEGAEDILLISVEKLVEDIVPSEHRFRPIVLNAKTQGTILRFTNEDTQWQSSILKYCSAIQKAASEYLRIEISIGLSSVFAHLIASKKAVDEGKEALHFRMNLGSQAVIFYDEIASQFDEGAVVQYPKEEEEVLLDAIRKGDENELVPAFETVLQKIFSNNRNPLSIETALLQLTNNILRLGQLLGADYEIFQNNRHIYTDLLNTDDPKKIHDLLYAGLILPIVETVKDKTGRELRSLSEKIVHIVHQQFDQDISLESIADELHYNPNYLSSVFKKEFGSNFGDFLQNYRLEMAKKWLLETELTVKEISQRLKYNNPQNFIRFFKKKLGQTPGEFRKEHKNY